MSFNIAISGLNAAQTDLSTTANNIANASTSGFKNGRAQFSDIFTRGSASAGGAVTRVLSVAGRPDPGAAALPDAAGWAV